MAPLPHIPPLAFAFAPALHPHCKRRRLGEIQAGRRRVQEKIGGMIGAGNMMS